MTTPYEAHAARDVHTRVVACAVLTISDTRTRENDESGDLIVELLGNAGHRVADPALVKDDADAIEAQLEQWLTRPDIHAILTTGGTGISRRDTTIEVVRQMLTIELEGFGELFRMLSFKQVGGAAMLSRAVGGLVIRDAEAGGETLVFAMPGSRNAVETAMKNLIAPQLAHLVWERRR